MTWSKLQAAAAFLLLAGLIPALAAYESSLVNVTSHIVQPPPPSQNDTTAAVWANYQEDGYLLAYHPALAFEGERGSWDHTRVFVGEVACWEFALTVTNTYPYEMGEVVVFDKYGAMRMDDGVFLADAVDVYKREPTGGQILKRPETPDSFTQQIEFTWYPGLDVGELGATDPGFRPSDSELAPGEVQAMTVTLCTKQNPSFKQEFTSLGRYQMNEGAIFSWLDPQGHRFSSVEKALKVEVIVRPLPEPEVNDKEERKAKKAEEKAAKELEKSEKKAEKELEKAGLEAEPEQSNSNTEVDQEQVEAEAPTEDELEASEKELEKSEEKAEKELEKAGLEAEPEQSNSNTEVDQEQVDAEAPTGDELEASEKEAEKAEAKATKELEKAEREEKKRE